MGFYDWNYALERLRSRGVLSFSGKNTLLEGKTFVILFLIKNFQGTTKFGGKILRGALPPTSSRGYGPAEEIRAINETRR